jgi:hypothetical protein
VMVKLTVVVRGDRFFMSARKNDGGGAGMAPELPILLGKGESV